MAKSTTKNNGISIALIYAIAALVVFSTLAVVGIYAKYTVGDKAKGYVSAAKFYFTSDILKDTPVTYTLNPGVDGTTSISFELRNYSDVFNWSDNTISYTVSVSPSDGVTVNPSSETISGGSAQSAKVTISGLKNGTTYTVTATGDAGYVSTLSAIIVVKPDENNIYYHVSPDPQGNYILLTVWTENIKGNVRVDFPGGLIPDSSDPVLYKKDIDDAIITDTENFKKTYSSHVYRFFAPDGNATYYAARPYTVTITPETGDPKTATASTPN